MENLTVFTEERFTRLLRDATGIDDVKPGWRPPISATVMLDTAIGTRSTQRICLQEQEGNLALFTWPAELKRQAKALYRTDRAQRLMAFAAECRGLWLAWPNVHLAFRNSPASQRLYLPKRRDLGLGEYIQRWQGDDFARIRAYRYDQIRDDLWPWLREIEYVDREDDQLLDEFLGRLGRRDAHLRPGIEVQRTWRRADAVDLDRRGVLASEVRTAVGELLAALDEPLPPACTPARH
jgi:hypothetical protein